MMNMLSDFFDITQDSRSIFEGLAISKNKSLCDKWMNQYPVLFISFKEIEGRTFAQALNKIRLYVNSICKNFTFLLNSEAVDISDREDIETLKAKQGDEDLLANSLKILCSALHAYYGKPVIVLIDEYDVPLGKAQENGYYADMADFMRSMLSPVLKDYNILQFGILTGCLRISKESAYTGLNNLWIYGISDVRFADKFGFTSKEVDDLLAVAGFSEKKDVIKEWYDGYRFGDDTEIYCPWDILQYIEELQAKPASMPKAYWQNTSGNDIVRSFVDHCNVRDVRDSLDLGTVKK